MLTRITTRDLHVTKRSAWKTERKEFVTVAFVSFVLFQLVFLANFCLLYGSQYENRSRTHNLNVLAVDYDGGVIGQSLIQAYNKLKSPTFPTFDIRPASDYPTVDELQELVCRGDYWAAIYTLPGASSRLSQAMRGGQAAASYESNQTIRYVWNEARSTTTAEAFVRSNMEVVIAASRMAYTAINGTKAYSMVNGSDPYAIRAFMNPISSSSINLKPTLQGGRIFYNSISLALGITQQFFFIMAINGLSDRLQLHSKVSAITNGLLRTIFASLYTLVGALCWTSYVYAFREDWVLNGRQFMLLWMLGWLFQYVNFIVLDAIATLVPMQVMPFLMLTWICANLASSLPEMAVAPAFYRFGYAMPAHNWYNIFVQIVSGGCYNHLGRALPILFAWLVLGQSAIIPATLRRCHAAQQVKSIEEKAFGEAGSSAQTEELKGDESESSAARPVMTEGDLLAKLETCNDQSYGPRIPLRYGPLERALSKA